jgi:hypothetical protein
MNVFWHYQVLILFFILTEWYGFGRILIQYSRFGVFLEHGNFKHILNIISSVSTIIVHQ